ncbi:MAG: VWA domain-containing protein [Gemmataceae bacterium]
MRIYHVLWLLPVLACFLVAGIIGCTTPAGMALRSMPTLDSGASESGEASQTARQEQPAATGVLEPEPQAGILTAGSFDDTAYPKFFRKFIQKVDKENGQGSNRVTEKLQGKLLVLQCVDSSGGPVGNAKVRVINEQNRTIAKLVSRSDGRILLMPSWDGYTADDRLRVQITPPNGGQSIVRKLPKHATNLRVTVPDATSEKPSKLDLVLVLDTTGSMDDELNYLKAEIKSIIKKVSEKFPSVEQRYSLIVYRDDGDEYVVRKSDFTKSVDRFQRTIEKENAAGGGDQPEAVHRGLEEAARLQWRSGDTARVVFFIADAPPHAKHQKRTLAAVQKLRSRGIAIYPVACSDTQAPLEILMRGSAMLTGGQYLFLTDDSDVGDSHEEPHIPFYHVQHLNQLMVRMVSNELAGRQLPIDEDDIVRTVGNPPK